MVRKHKKDVSTAKERVDALEIERRQIKLDLDRTEAAYQLEVEAKKSDHRKHVSVVVRVVMLEWTPYRFLPLTSITLLL
jgi:predicted phage tail protein